MWSSVALTVQEGTSIWIISIADVLVGTLLRKVLHGNILSLIFIALWWIPSRYTVALALRPNLSAVDQPLKESTRQLVKRGMTAAVAVLGIVSVEKFLGLNVSPAMTIILPLIALFVHA